jgi:hypothetical protein
MEQQQARMTEMYNQLPTDYQVQIQSALSVYNQQLADQNHDAATIQGHVWNYYTQCVESMFQQHQQYTQALHAQQQVASPQEAEQPAQQQPASSEQGPPPQQDHAEQVAINGTGSSGASNQLTAEELAMQKAAEEERLKAKKLQDEQDEKDEEEQFQKRIKNMDPILAARLTKQREKQRAGEAVVDIGSAAQATKHVDPMLAKRWATLQEKQGEWNSSQGVDATSSTGPKPWEERTQNSELGKKNGKATRMQNSELGEHRGSGWSLFQFWCSEALGDKHTKF